MNADAVPTTFVEDELRVRINAGPVDVEWWDGDQLLGGIFEIVDVGRDVGVLYFDTTDGLRYYVPEQREVTVRTLRSNVIEFPTPADPAIAIGSIDDPPIIGRAQFEDVSGAAGSGKSYAAKAYVADHPGEAVLTSSTGVSAVNLGDATTINSFLGYFDEASLRDKIVSGRIQSALRGHRKRGVQRIILDEKSMISATVLDDLCYVIDQVNEDVDVKVGTEPPISLTLVGDFAQLPPVQGNYCFRAGSWSRFAEHSLQLTKIWRQADPHFVEGLRAARRGDIERMLEVFAPRCRMTTDGNFDGTTIFATNKEVDNWNGLKHQALPGVPVEFRTERWGQQKSEWKDPTPKEKGKKGGHVPDVLKIKPGALVMILANEHDRERGNLVYSNGDLGHFLQYYEEERIDAEGEHELVPMAVVRLMRNNEVVGVPYVVRRWEVVTAAPGDVKAKVEIIGSVKYMPLRLAYASTVHKTQSISLDAVQCVITHKFFAAPSMLYVALSRARTIEGVTIVGTPQLLRERCGVDPVVVNWL